jgi:aspartyl aminopeptidase
MSTTFFDEKIKPEDIPQEDKLINNKLGTKLANLISKELGVKKSNIIDFDLCLYDCQDSTLLGIDQEFVSSGRLDNLASSLVGLHALINDTKNIEYQTSINFLAMFDNEEIGSTSYQGADGQFFGNNLERIFLTTDRNNSQEKNSNFNFNGDEFMACCSRSLVISADMAHGSHPNYQEKHQNEHRPYFHEGIVIKINPNMRYATDSEGSSIIKEVARRAEVPVQEFIIRQDSPCGSTIGPIIAGKLGIKTIDIGIPQFAMHSIRELCGVCDLEYYRRFFEEFYSGYEKCVGDLILH